MSEEEPRLERCSSIAAGGIVECVSAVLCYATQERIIDYRGVEYPAGTVVRRERDASRVKLGRGLRPFEQHERAHDIAPIWPA